VGHVVRERQGAIICAMPGIHSDEQWQHFSEGMEIIHRDCGVYMRRNKKDDRPMLPASIMRLRTMCDVAEQHKWTECLGAEVQPCCICGMASGDDLTRCPVCLLVGHRSCCARVLEKALKDGRMFFTMTTPKVDMPGMLQHLRRDAFCALCQRSLPPWTLLE
jgi:hypothetical protein